MESHRFSAFLALSSKILTFLSRHTAQIKAMHAVCHKTMPGFSKTFIIDRNHVENASRGNPLHLG